MRFLLYDHVSKKILQFEVHSSADYTGHLIPAPKG